MRSGDLKLMMSLVRRTHGNCPIS